MNKSQLVEALAVHFDGNRRPAQHALESVIDTVERELTKKGGKVAITGFGAFEAIERGARMVRNPRTGETKRAKKTVVPKFRAGAELKAVVSGAKKLPKLVVPKPADRHQGSRPGQEGRAGEGRRDQDRRQEGAGQGRRDQDGRARRPRPRRPRPRPSPRRPPAKKAPAKTVAKKAPAKKAPAKKAPAKRAAAR